jgi:riboflavin synthase
MFTGIVQKKGRIAAVERSGGSGRLSVEASAWDPALVTGESVAIDGVCLTLTGVKGLVMQFDLLKETFDRTHLGARRSGDSVNLERALRVGDALGGHFVTGHVDGVGTVRKITPVGRDWILEVACAPDLLLQMVGKGSIAVAGVSLTIVDLKRDAFTVHLIPHTWESTSLSALQPGQPVNLETDMLGKYVQRILSARTAVTHA